jgi:predicted transcriptional regulator|tara:strand:- start:352 stop:537 length:186 start_codon:yes stop_codon:yes gene_type:complete
MTLQDQCREFKVKLNEIANDLGYTRQYVYMVVGGKRQNNKITTAVYLALEARKKELRELIA